MTSWKTTLSGAVTSGAGLVLALSGAGVQIPHWLVVTAGFIMAGGFASMGLTAKDSTVHSTVSQVQTSTIETAAKS